LEQKLANLFYTDSLLDDMGQSTVVHGKFDSKEFLIAEKRIEDAIDFLEKNFPEMHFILQLAIDSIFIRKSDASGGGSTSNAIGVIWINNREHWTTEDLVELLVHELSHNLMFIDELRYLHYPDYNLILDECNYSPSAILHTKRPIDKVVHSIVVATEVVALRRKYLGEPKNPCVHPPTNKIIEQTLSAYQSLKSMSNYKQLTTDRARYLLDKCSSSLENYRTYDKQDFVE